MIPGPAALRHELRTPLNHIIGYSELLLEEVGEGGCRDLEPGLRRIHEDARRLLRLVEVPVHAHDEVVRHVEEVGPEDEAGQGRQEAVPAGAVAGDAQAGPVFVRHGDGAPHIRQRGLDVAASLVGEVPELHERAVDERDVVASQVAVEAAQVGKDVDGIAHRRQAVVAADYIRNLREETRKGFYGRLKQGVFPLPAPIGYRDMGKGRPKEPDPATAPLVRRAFELYGTGTFCLRTLREQITYNGVGGGEVNAEIHDPWSRLTATEGTKQAHQVEDVRVRTRTPIPGGVRRTEVTKTYDEYGNETQVNDLGDVAVTSDDQCTTTTYNRNTAAMLVSLPSTDSTGWRMAAACSAPNDSAHTAQLARPPSFSAYCRRPESSRCWFERSRATRVKPPGCCVPPVGSRPR